MDYNLWTLDSCRAILLGTGVFGGCHGSQINLDPRKSTRADATNAASVVPSVQAAVVAHATCSVEQV